MTFEELKAAGFVEHHRCGGCGAPVGYQVHSVYAIAIFNAECNCGMGTDRRGEDYQRPITHSELAAIPPTPQE